MLRTQTSTLIRLALGLIIAPLAGASTPYLPAAVQPGSAIATASSTEAALSNEAISARWSTASGTWRLNSITNHYSGELFSSPSSAELFIVELSDGARVAASEMTATVPPSVGTLTTDPSAARYAERLPGQSIVAEFQAPEHNLKVLWTADLRDGSHYIRPQIEVSSIDGTSLTTNRITLLELPQPTTASGSHSAVDTPVEISSTGTPTITSSITVPSGAGNLTDANVTLDINHTWVGDLSITLIHPDGTRVSLSSNNGTSGDDYTNTTFDQSAGSSITSASPPFTGTFRPEGDLDSLIGKTASGTWTLEIADSYSADGGSLQSWSLDLTTDAADDGSFSTIGTVDGSPQVSDDFFIAFEHPSSQYGNTAHSGRQIGTWSVDEPDGVRYGPTNVDFDITPYAAEGNLTISFNYESGPHRLNINGVTLLEDGVATSSDNHFGYAGLPNNNNSYTVTLSDYSPTKSYSVRANIDVTESGSNSYGSVTLTTGSTIVATVTGEQTISPGNSATYSSVYGVVVPGQLRRSFLCYTERERAHAYRQFLHYNSWLDVSWNDGSGSTMTEANTLTSMQGHIDHFIAPFNEPYAAFVFDDGWDNWNSLWEFNDITFPNQFTPMESLAASHGVKLGAWLSPFGGYDPAKSQRIAYGASQDPAFETNANGFSLSGPNYYEAFRNRCLQMVRDYSFSYFKFDGIGAGNGASGAGSEYFADIEAMRKLTRELRRSQNDLFINLTVGSWPSPYWLWSADSIWRAGSDMGFTGAGNNHERWITYRDHECYKNVVQRAPLYPLNSIMLHGVVWANYQHANDSDFNSASFKSDVRAYFGSGTNIQELYINPIRLNEGDWHSLAEAVKWSRENTATLSDTHWIGGNPGNAEVYGWAAWQPDQGVLTLRNPSNNAQSITFTLQDVFELPTTGASVGYYLKSPWIEDAAQPASYHGINESITLTLAAFEVVTLDATPTTPPAWHGNAVFREWAMKRRSGQRDGNGSFGSTGSTNEVAFALGLDPNSSTEPVSTRTLLIANSDAPGGYQFQFTRAAELGTTTLVTEVSTDMENWESGASHVEPVSEVSLPDGSKLVTIQASSLYQEAGRIFFRLRVGE
ncbi:proprotein convertase P-domain-containing protein [Sulfuriroseicoccus oceanibius]|uniref:Proprotein convertase P-domain-containing protein n=1 Tax=Sulfuriroseicoccus oceanibius TaxID=2707525 RepID=A0A6B3L7J5_9BACT|nr:proprotein convertase P-domain-containing protein [Sulfuriroseicoccus oceanibius]QQL44469.1 proprotein convertase P-domain-containing protein [Sulfuriroseicoccus oceanibius]